MKEKSLQPVCLFVFLRPWSCSLQLIPDIVVYWYSQKPVLVLARVLYIVKVKIKRGLSRRGETQTTGVKQISKKFAGNIKKRDLLFLASPFSVASDALEPFSERAHVRSPREVGEKTRAVFLCTGGRVEAAFLLLPAEIPCWEQPWAGHAAPFHRCRRFLLFCGSGRATTGHPRERTRTTKAAGSTGSPHLSHSSSGIFFLSPFWISEVLFRFSPLFTTSAGGFCSSMAAVTSPETSPQPRVYFQTPTGTTEEPETPVRKQGRVTVKYDRKELRKRLNLEEWIIDQLTDLYDCEVKTL